MNADLFVERFPGKKGLYAIRNRDSTRGPWHVKIGKGRIAGRMDNLQTATPFGLEVLGFLSVPDHRPAGFTRGPADATDDSRIASREREAHKLLENAPFIVRHQRRTGRTTRANQTEWFRPPSGPGDSAFAQTVVRRSLGTLSGKYGDSKLWRCTAKDCHQV
jgi:hypothetical protein